MREGMEQATSVSSRHGCPLACFSVSAAVCILFKSLTKQCKRRKWDIGRSMPDMPHAHAVA